MPARSYYHIIAPTKQQKNTYACVTQDHTQRRTSRDGPGMLSVGDRWALTVLLVAANVGLAVWLQAEVDTPLAPLLRRYSDDRGTYVKLAADPTVVAFDAHRTVSAPHPRRPSVRQRFLRPTDQEVFSKMTPSSHPQHAARLHHFYRTGEMPAVDVHAAEPGRS